MLENNFMAGSAHISGLDPKADGMPVLMASSSWSMIKVMAWN